MNVSFFREAKAVSRLVAICAITAVFEVWAVQIKYEMTFDPLTGMTTIYNDPTSLAPLDFHTLVGSSANKNRQIAPGDTVTVDNNGALLGAFRDAQVICNNKLKSQRLTRRTFIHNTGTTDITITYFPSSGGSPVVATLSPGDVASVGATDRASVDSGQNGRFQVRECEFDSLAPDTEFYISSPLYQFQGQDNYQLLSGSISSIDDTDSFSAVFTSNVATGCLPDSGSTLFALAIGLTGLAGLARKRTVAD